MKTHRFPRSYRAPRSQHDSPWRIATTAAGLVITLAVVICAIAIFAVPRLMGGASLTVLSGSMRPAFSPGDVVVVRGINQSEVCSHVRIGQIITYLPKPNDPSLITHRVVGKTIGTFPDGTSCRVITQGDANSAADEPVSPVQVRGVFMYRVPKLGWARQWVTGHLRIVEIAAGVLLAGYLLVGTRRPAKVRVIPVPGTGPSTDPDNPDNPDTPGGPVPVPTAARAGHPGKHLASRHQTHQHSAHQHQTGQHQTHQHLASGGYTTMRSERP